MKLVIYGKEDLNTLENWASEIFTQVPNHSKIRPVYNEPAFNNENLSNLWKITPVKDKDLIEFSWVLKNLDQYYRSHPGKYINHLIGHEGENSLLSLLIDEGLALELSSGYDTEINQFTKFSITIQLTKKGMSNYKEVCAIIFKYLQMLKQKGTEKRIFEEIQSVYKMKFMFKDKEQPMNYTSHLASFMQYYPIEDIARLPYLFEEYQSDLINEVVNSFNIDNMRINLISKSLEEECNQVEPWYGTKYSVESLPRELQEMWHNPIIQPKSSKKLDLPPQNIYIPKNFNLYSNSTQLKYPEKIYESDCSVLWYKQDDTFNRPKGGVFLNIYSNDCEFGKSEEAYLLSEIWLRLYKDSIRETLYLMSMAGVNISIDISSSGIDIDVTGFDDTLDKVSEKICHTLETFEPSLMEDHFKNIYDEMIKGFKNFEKNAAYQQAFSYENVLINKGNLAYTHRELLKSLENLTFNDLLKFHKKWLTTIRSEWLIIGNITRNKALETCKNCEKVIQNIRKQSQVLLKELIPEIRTVNIPNNTTWLYEEKLSLKGADVGETNSAIIAYFQYEQENPKSRVSLRVLSNYLRDPCFDRLRTDEQLGYIVSGSHSENRGILGYYILIQSSIAGPQFLSSRIRAFLDSTRDKIKNITEEEFKTFVQSVRIKIMQKDLSIYEEAYRYLNEINKHKYVFDRSKLSDYVV